MPLFLALLFVLILTGCEKPASQKELRLEPASFAELPGWEKDNFKLFAQAFERSCTRILKNDPDKEFGALKQAGTYAPWQEACRKFAKLNKQENENIRLFLEENFQPYTVFAGQKQEGLFTGYYEASLKGSRRKHGPYIYPLYKRPGDLVMVDLGAFREELKGQRIAGRVNNGNLAPYETRADIVSGNWPHKDQVLVWVDDPVDAFFVQVQGSGIVQLSRGRTMRIGYAGQNGHPYYAIGKELIKQGALTPETTSMQSIRAWLEANPDQADALMNTNKSYVFFQELYGEGPLGGEGVPLTPGRSLAIDRSLVSYGIPVWTDIENPVQGISNIRALMVAQDTGGAITGPVRADVFWGYGSEAEEIAGIMKSKGRYWFLLPRTQNPDPQKE